MIAVARQVADQRLQLTCWHHKGVFFLNFERPVFCGVFFSDFGGGNGVFFQNLNGGKSGFLF